MMIQSGLNAQDMDLVILFKSFYVRVLKVRSMIEDGAIDWPLLIGEEVDDQTSDHDQARMISEYLSSSLIDQKERVLTRSNQVGVKAHRQASYLMCALTDEIFLLRLNWFGARYWNEFSLEKSLFSSSYAGDEFYQRLNRIISKDALSRFEKQLATIFLFSLRLGFRGKLLGQEKQVLAICKQLHSKTGFLKAEETLFESAYRSIINPPVRQRLEPFTRWHRMLFILFLGYLIVCSGAWWWLTNRFVSGTSTL